MSYTQLFFLKKDGSYTFEEVHPAIRGAYIVWTRLEKKYLPPYRIYGMQASRVFARSASKTEQEKVWNLIYNKDLTESEHICMLSTYDNVLCKIENFQKLIKAFREFPFDSNLKEQADIIDKYANMEDIAYLGWNQTSVNSDVLWRGEYSEDPETYEDIHIPYDFSGKHWFLFDHDSFDKRAQS